MPVAAIGSAVIGAGASIYGSTQQANAAQAGIQAQQQMYQQGMGFAQQQQGLAQSTLNPFISSGWSGVVAARAIELSGGLTGLTLLAARAIDMKEGPAD